MNNNDLTIRTFDDGLRSVSQHVTSEQPNEWALRGDCSNGVPPTAEVRSPADRIRRASVLAGLIVVVPLLVMTGCGGDADGPVPTTLAPAAGTAPLTTIGAGVPLEPGSNLPPVEGDDESITTSTG